MNLRRFSLLAMSVFAALLVCAAVASAAEESGNSAEHATELFKLINFAIVAAVVIWVFGKMLPPKFRANAETISSAIAKATAAKAEADRQLKDAETRLARLEQEVAELRAAGQIEAAADGSKFARWRCPTQKRFHSQQKRRSRQRSARRGWN